MSTSPIAHTSNFSPTIDLNDEISNESTEMMHRVIDEVDDGGEGTSSSTTISTKKKSSDGDGECSMASTTTTTAKTLPATCQKRLIIDGSKSPEKCPICLSIPDDRSFTDTCYHEFCYVCLLEWSKVKSECPLCKQKFKNIIHNVRSIDDFDKYEIPEASESFGIDDSGRRFRYPTTMTIERMELLRWIRQLYLELEEMHRNNQILQENRPIYMRQLARVGRLRHLFNRSGERRERLTATSDFRRLVYERRLRAIPPGPDVRTRRCSPSFFSRNPACIYRLVPWLDRELNVLFNGQSGRVQFLMDLVRNMVVRWPIDSDETRRYLRPYLAQNADAFIHEFHNFARSTLDMEEYDRTVQYESWRDVLARQRGPNEAPPEEIVIGSSPPPDRGRERSSSGPRDRAGPSHNPSPPPFQAFSFDQPRRGRFGGNEAPTAMLDRCQQILEANLVLLDRGGPGVRGSQPYGIGLYTLGNGTNRYRSSRERDGIVDLTSSSDDDSPRLGPTDRTPPYLLRSNNNKRSMTYQQANAKRRRLGGPSMASVVHRPTTSGLDNGASSSIIIEDEDDEENNERDRSRPYDDVSVLPFSPAARRRSPEEYDDDVIVDNMLDSDRSSRQSDTSRDEERTPDYSSPQDHLSEIYGRYKPYEYDSPASRIASDDSRESIDYNRRPRLSPSPSPNGGTYRWTNFARRPFSVSPTISCHSVREEPSRTPSPINADEIQIVAELKPKYLRTPDVVVLNDDDLTNDDDNEIERKPIKLNEDIMRLNSRPMYDEGPSTSDGARRGPLKLNADIMRLNPRPMYDEGPSTSDGARRGPLKLNADIMRLNPRPMYDEGPSTSDGARRGPLKLNADIMRLNPRSMYDEGPSTSGGARRSPSRSRSRSRSHSGSKHRRHKHRDHKKKKHRHHHHHEDREDRHERKKSKKEKKSKRRHRDKPERASRRRERSAVAEERDTPPARSRSLPN